MTAARERLLKNLDWRAGNHLAAFLEHADDLLAVMVEAGVIERIDIGGGIRPIYAPTEGTQ